jgi:hypothetical protein
MLLITRRYRTLLGFAGGAAALAILPILTTGSDVWSGYIQMLVALGSQARVIRIPTNYVDLGAFADLVPGGHSWTGRVILVAFAGWAGISLLRLWLRSNTNQKSAMTLVWATTLTWTLVLNVYVGIWDTIQIVISVVATVTALHRVQDRQFHRRLTILWALVFAASWITEDVAKLTGFQVMTASLALLGVFQICAFGRIQQPATAPAEAETIGLFALSHA